MVESSEEELRQAFQKIDLNGDGNIEKEEIREISKQLGKPISDYELNKVKFVFK